MAIIKHKIGMIAGERNFQKVLFLNTQCQHYGCNVYLGGSECDFVGIRKSGYWAEYEIKVSRSDFFNDKKKINKHAKLSDCFNFKSSGRFLVPNYFFYVVPNGMVSIDEMPKYAGLIYIHDYRMEVVKNAPRLHKEKLKPDYVLGVLNSMSWKFFQQMQFEEQSK